MPPPEIGLVARARGLAVRLLSRESLESLAAADGLDAFARDLSRFGPSVEPVSSPLDAFAVERAAGRTANRLFSTLSRWQERTPGVLDVFVAYQDRRSLRALLRGAVQGAPSDVRLAGLFPTPSLPLLALAELARQAVPAGVVGHMVLLRHPDAPRLASLVRTAQVDLLAIDRALLAGFAQRAGHAAARGDRFLKAFVHQTIDVGNVQNALLLAREPKDLDPAELFVGGGRWLSDTDYETAVRAGSAQQSFAALSRALSGSPLASWLRVVAREAAQMDRAFVAAMLEQLRFATRLEPLSTAPLLRVLLLIDAQARDLRTLGWGAALGTPRVLRVQQLVTPP